MIGEYIGQICTGKGNTLTKSEALLKQDSANLSKIKNRESDLTEKLLDKLATVFFLDLEKLKTEYLGDQFGKKNV